MEMDTQNGVALAGSGNINDGFVLGDTAQGLEFQAVLLRMTRNSAAFELHDPTSILRNSEVIDDFKIVVGDRTTYIGNAVVSKLINTGLGLTIEVILDEKSWIDDFSRQSLDNRQLGAEFRMFVGQWQKLYKILPEFKIAVADMQSFLSDFKFWLDQIELCIRSQPVDDGGQFESKTLRSLCEASLPILGTLFERFEKVTSTVEKELQPTHSFYAKRQLHPLVLCAPFMYRTFRKPLGYAGDYEMVNMMAKDSFQGASVFAKVLNTFFLNTPPVVAHRNRIDYLTQMLAAESVRLSQRKNIVRVLNLGCGPALEIQAFLKNYPLSSNFDFTLLDFNDETVDHAKRVLATVKQTNNRNTRFHVLKKSVAQLLKEQAKPTSALGGSRFDIVYCAGLFDYLADPVCQKLLDVFYSLLTPDGLVVATNVNVSNPSQGWMDYMVDWHLCYRNSRDMERILPAAVTQENCRILTDSTGVNVLVEARKPKNA